MSEDDSNSEVSARQRDIWNAVSAGWANQQREFERGASVVTEHLIRASALSPGIRVLDVGSGLGEPAASAADAVGPTGRVLALDLAEKMVEAARENVGRREGLEFAVGDVMTMSPPAGSFDVALSRWGLMFAADRVAALRAVRRALVPGGVLAAAVWGEPAAVPMIGLGFRVISGLLDLSQPPPNGPGPFTMSDSVLVERELVEAGFIGITIDELTVPFELDSPRDFATYTLDVLPPGLRQTLRERRGSVRDPEVLRALAEAVAEFTGTDGVVRLPSSAMCLRAEVPA